MKKFLSFLLAAALLLGIPGVSGLQASAAGAYEGKTVIIYTGNLCGEVGGYASVAAAKAYYQEAGADVLLLDAGNYLQGQAEANSLRGQYIYALMDAAAYDAAAMGRREFYYADATTGSTWHSNYYMYYTQAQLYRGTPAVTYQQGSGEAPVSRPEKAAAAFAVLSSNVTAGPDSTGYYDFDESSRFAFEGGLSVGVYALTQPDVPAYLQDDAARGYTFGAPEEADGRLQEALGDCDITVCLDNAGAASAADVVLSLPADGSSVTGVCVIDNSTGSVSRETLPQVTPDADVAALAKRIQNSVVSVGQSSVVLNGADSANRNGETNLGDLTADALKWYAEHVFSGFMKDVPVVAIQNGGNCTDFLYDGEITSADLLRALPYSPNGIGILYMKGSQLLEVLEAATQQADCPGWAQVSGLEYTVSTYKTFDAGDRYGEFYRVKDVKRVTITSVGGEEFDENAVYAVVADNFLMNGGDTYYLMQEIKASKGSRYLNNGNSVKTRDVVARYIEQALNGRIGSAYGAPQGRITILTEEPAEPEEPFVNPFTDVKETDWYYDAVMYTCQRGLFRGINEETFAPDGTMLRAMMVTLLYRMEGEPDVSGYENPFADVPDDEWYADAVRWAYAEGIVTGPTPTTFAPALPLTREQAATLLYRYAGYKGYDVPTGMSLDGFPDAALVNDYAKVPMEWAVQEGLIRGAEINGGYYLCPLYSATRAQLAVILMRFMEDVTA